MDQILHYFPKLSPLQIQQFEQLGELYKEWNDKINVISRKDIDNLYPHHILHSLAIARLVSFHPESDVLDLGTGGGLPGIPLAILFPEANFLMVDGTRKKITVTQTIIEEIGLKNAQAKHIRAEELKQKFDFVVCRAVARLEKLMPWTRMLLKEKEIHGLPNGLITLKGGSLQEEIEALPGNDFVDLYPITDFFDMPYYEEKYIVYVQG